ncbi:MAG TPA: SDR family NAD(P)-dependent oxidoreductase [Oceanospirillaceae bacterium]|jgi:NAD(P)-dependent dehydrogenase (short-subunit alcohol dehydrogenase family)|nr:SDR family NAD(P)-dependent oxidoreductase [Oceanospirillaceae bacterium]
MGIYGQAIIKTAAAHKQTVLALGRDEDKLDQQKQAGLIKDYFVIAANSYEQHQQAYKAWLNTHQITVFIHCAGVGSKGSSLQKESSPAITQSIDANVNYFFSLTQALMQSHSASQCNKVIAISSRRGSVGMAADSTVSNAGCSYAYRIAKAALNMTLCCLAEEFADTGPAFYAIHPGKLISKMGVGSADVEPLVSAQRLFKQVINTDLAFGFYTLQDSNIANLAW